MRHSLLTILFLFSIAVLVGCQQDTLKLPDIDDNHVIVSHVKTPQLSVIDRVEQKVVHEETLDFVIHMAVRVNSDQLVLATSGEPSVRLLHLTDGSLQTLDIQAENVTCLHVDPSGELLFIADADNDQLLVYDLEAETVLQQLDIDGHLNAMDVYAQSLYVLDKDTASVSVIDLTTYEVVHTFPVVGHPTTIVVTEKHVWIGGHGAVGELNKHVHIYEASSGQPTETIQTGTMPIALYHDEYSTDMFVLSHGSNEMHIIDMQAMTVKEKLTTADNPFYVQADEQFIYVTALDGDSLSVIDRERYEVIEHYSLAPGPYGIVLGGDR